MKVMVSSFRDKANLDGLASWENEGGAIVVSVDSQRRSFAGFWPASTLDDRVIGSRNDDFGISDTHTLSMLRMSLLLFLPTLGVLTMFWVLSSPDVLR